jgi:hypothetical protein
MDNICYICNKNPGIECPGRRPDERTKCKECLYKYMVSGNIEDAIYRLNCINNLVQDDNIDYARRLVESFKQFDEYAWKFYSSLLNY